MLVVRGHSLSHPAVPPQATVSNVHSGWAREITTTDYAPTCGNRRRQGSSGILNSASNQGQPTRVPRTPTQILYGQAATLDTEPLAKSYSGGDHTRLYSIHFQSARASLGSSFLLLSDGGTRGSTILIPSLFTS